MHIGVPKDDFFHRTLELEADNFSFDASYPDVRTTRTDDFVLIEIVMSVGRSVKVKKELLSHLMDGLRGLGLDAENVMVCIIETQWENWSFAGGRQIHVS